VEAGNDLVLLCHRPELIPEAARALGSISPARAAQAGKQVESFLARLQPPHEFSVEKHATLDAQVMQLRIDTLGAEQAAQRSADDGKRSPVETF
jgi:beta-N-acetylhexosaminidase